MGALTDLFTASRRKPPAEAPDGPPADTLQEKKKEPRAVAFDQPRISDMVSDNIFDAIHNLWADRQQHGRLQYEAMVAHPTVYAALHSRVALLKSHRPRARARGREVPQRRKDIADYVNHVVSTMDWNTFMDGIVRAGLHYGFSLAEVNTTVRRWRGLDRVVLDSLTVLPQASLDNGFVPREEFSSVYLSLDPRYRCFTLDDNGRITRITQNARLGDGNKLTVTWQGPRLKHILHHKHGGGDGNPYGESALFGAYTAWASLYTLEQLEEVFLDTSLPTNIISYKSVDGQPRPALHDEIEAKLAESYLDAARRTLIGPDLSGQSMAPSNPNFTDHVAQKKAELKKYIWEALMLPRSVVTESTGEQESDTRNLVSVYFKYLVKSDLEEITATLQTLLRRLIEANWSDLDEEDFPELNWSIVLDNDLRVAQLAMQQALPYISSDKLGEFYHEQFDWFDPALIAEDHADSVAIKRPVTTAATSPTGGSPPQKEPGENKQRTDKQTDNPSTSIDTAAEADAE